MRIAAAVVVVVENEDAGGLARHQGGGRSLP